jgi:hypothetical protein
MSKAASTFGARETFFVTNGTSPANKIVVQALTRPGEIVLINRNCHKSHHYGLALAGALPLYPDAYPLEDHAIYGGVPLCTIKQTLLDLNAAGRLDQVRMLLLTNCGCGVGGSPTTHFAITDRSSLAAAMANKGFSTSSSSSSIERNSVLPARRQ